MDEEETAKAVWWCEGLDLTGGWARWDFGSLTAGAKLERVLWLICDARIVRAFERWRTHEGNAAVAELVATRVSLAQMAWEAERGRFRTRSDQRRRALDAEAILRRKNFWASLTRGSHA